jgi:hypothetical protein
MKNLFVLPTPKPSRLQLKMDNTFHIENGQSIPLRSYQHIYIISDETFNKDSWCLHQIQHEYYLTKAHEDNALLHYKVILTTDPELIKNGVQAISDTFLEWFIKHPTCEQVDVIYGLFNPMGRQVDPMNLTQNHSECVWKYQIMIKETIEEASERLFNDFQKENQIVPKNYIMPHKLGFFQGFRYHQEISYTKEDMIAFAEFVATYPDKNRNIHHEILHAKSKYDGAERTIDLLAEWSEQFKKK